MNSDSRSTEETAEWALNDAVNALNCMATNVSFHDAAISEAWMKSKRTVMTMRDRLADPALGEAIERLRNAGYLTPHDTRALRIVLDTITALRGTHV